MKIKIRGGLFETNSSSTHSMVIMTEKDFRKWESGYYYYKPYNYKYELEHEYLDPSYKPVEKALYSEDEVRQFLLHNASITQDDFEDNDFEDLAYDSCFYSINKFDRDGELEIDEAEFTTPNGDRVICHCAYGYGY